MEQRIALSYIPDPSTPTQVLLLNFEMIALQMGTVQCTDLDKIAFLQNTFVFYPPKRQEIVSNKPQGCLFQDLKAVLQWRFPF